MSDHVLHLGDSGAVLRSLDDGSVDALVTDPPAGISFMGKHWDHDHGGRDGWVKAFAAIFSECLRVLRPGAHGLVWALPRTSHWTATALEDAGFEIRDVGVHIFGSGFPKSLDVSKAIDKAAGAERDVVATEARRRGECGEFHAAPRCLLCGMTRNGTSCRCPPDSGAATDAAKRWSGWGTALKPAAEHWILVRKPPEGTVAANVLAHGTGALNIDATRIGAGAKKWETPRGGIWSTESDAKAAIMDNPLGRWPANLTLSEEAAALLDEQSGESSGTVTAKDSGRYRGEPNSYGAGGYYGGRNPENSYSDSGGASRFFYVAKPDRSERDIGCEGLPAASGGEATGRVDGSAGTQNPRAGAGRNGGARNIHPTVKPVELMRWLCRLITPRGGLVLDPFMGSGTTGVACAREGFRFIGIEREAQYMEIAKRRIHGDAPLFNRPAVNESTDSEDTA